MIGVFGVFVAAFVVGVTGFGFNLLAVPLLALFMPAKDAVVAALVAGAIVNSALVFSDRDSLRKKLLGLVLVGSVPGVAIGAMVFAGASDQLLKLIIAALTGVFAVQLLLKPARKLLVISPPRVVGVGVVSGTLTAISGMGGPPLVAYLSQALPDPPQIRVTIASHTAVSSLVALTGILITGGLKTATVITGISYVVPGLLGLFAGSRLFSSRQEGYQRFVATTLLIVAIIGVSSVVVGLR